MSQKHRPVVAALTLCVAILGGALAAEPGAQAGLGGASIETPAVDPIQRVGAWPFGPSYAVDVDPVRDLVFLGAGGVVLILDGSDPTAPVLITDELRTVGLVEDIAYDAANQRLLLACGEGGLEIWDVAAPATPSRLSVTEVLYFGYDTPVGHVELWDHFAIVECEWGYVHSLDVSDPTQPVDVSFNGIMGNPARDIHVSSDGQVHTSGAQRYQRLYIDGSGQLFGSGAKDFDYGPYAVFGTPEVAYVGYGGYVYILDLLYPGFPPWAYFNAGGVDGIEVAEGVAYIINDIGLRIYDVSVHNNPFHLGTLSSELWFYDLKVADGLAYIAAGSDGLRVVDVSDPASPAEIGAYTDVLTVTWKVVLQGDLAYLPHDRDGVLVIDLTNLERPELAGRYQTPGVVRDAEIAGDLLFVAASDGGLRIANLTAPTAPAEIGALPGLDSWRVAVAGNVAYVVEAIPNEPYWLHSVDVSDPTAPVEMGSLQLPGLVWDLVVSGDHLYLAGHNDGVLIVDVSNSAAPALVGAFPLPSVTGLDLQDGLLYVAAHDNWAGGFFVLDTADPVNLAPVGNYMTAGFAIFHIDVQGDYAVVSRGEDLHLMFIGDPTEPVDLFEYPTPDDVVGITLRGRYVYVADAAAGLQVVENTLFQDPGGGLQWQTLASGVVDDLHAVCFGDALSGWAVGADGAILRTTDGGDSWTPQPGGTPASLQDIACLDADHAWLVGDSGTILSTGDGGTTWQVRASGTSAELSSVDFVDTDRGWAVGQGGAVLYTDDGGATWTPQASGTTTYLYSVSFADPLHGWIAAGDYGTVLRTTDGGASWQTVVTGSQYVFFDVHFPDLLNGWAVGMFGEIMATTDGGLTWTTQPSPHPPDWLYDVQFLDADLGFAVGFDGRILVADGGGTSWSDQPSPTHVQLNGVDFVDKAHGWAVGNDGVILRAITGPSSMIFADGFESGDTTAWSSGAPP